MLVDAVQVVSGLVSVPHARAFKITMEYGVPAYDARFWAPPKAWVLGLVIVTCD